MNEFLENLKRQAEANPIVALGVAAGVVSAITHLMNASSWKREVARRERMTPKK
jgi:hypothetical protein